MEINKVSVFKTGLALLLLIIIFTASIGYRSGVLFNDKKIAIWIFNVGQGDSIFISTSDQNILLDGGPTKIIIEKLSSIIPFWDRKIELLINSHPHADHITGLIPVLTRFSVDEIWTSGQNYNSGVFQYFEKITNESFGFTGQKENVSAGDEIRFSNGAILKVLWPNEEIFGQTYDDPNDQCVVLLLEYEGTRVLLLADSGIEQEMQFLYIGYIDILKVGHQGSMTSSGLEFLKTMKPEVSIIPVGKNDYGHPSPIIIDRLRSIGTQIFRTDIEGDIRILIDEDGYQIKTFDL